jgi:hypothetical protein
MLKSQIKMFETLEALIEEYSAFQRSRPDLPQGSLCDLSQDELELLVAAFQMHKSEQTDRPRRLHWSLQPRMRWPAMATPA